MIARFLVSVSYAPTTQRNALTLSLFLALFPVSVSAQVSADPEALIREGVQLRRDGRDEEALECFRRSWEIVRTPRARAQMGFAEQALGRWELAEAHVLEARAASADAWVRQHLDVIDRSLASSAQHLATLIVSGGVPGAQVLLDGHEAGTLPLTAPIRVVAGVLSLEVRAPAFVPERRTVLLAPGATGREYVDLAPLPSAALSTPPPTLSEAVTRIAPHAPPPLETPVAPLGLVVHPSTPSGMAPSRVAGVALAGIGLALAGVGLGLYLDVDARFDACLRVGCDADRHPIAQDNASVVMLWGGVVVAVAGAALALFAPARRALRTGTPSAWVDPRGIAGLGGNF